MRVADPHPRLLDVRKYETTFEEGREEGELMVGVLEVGGSKRGWCTAKGGGREGRAAGGRLVSEVEVEGKDEDGEGGEVVREARAGHHRHGCSRVKDSE